MSRPRKSKPQKEPPKGSRSEKQVRKKSPAPRKTPAKKRGDRASGKTHKQTAANSETRANHAPSPSETSSTGADSQADKTRPPPTNEPPPAGAASFLPRVGPRKILPGALKSRQTSPAPEETGANKNLPFRKPPADSSDQHKNRRKTKEAPSDASSPGTKEASEAKAGAEEVQGISPRVKLPESRVLRGQEAPAPPAPLISVRRSQADLFPLPWPAWLRGITPRWLQNKARTLDKVLPLWLRRPLSALLVRAEQGTLLHPPRWLRKRTPRWVRQLSSRQPLALPGWLAGQIPTPLQKLLGRVTPRRLTHTGLGLGLVFFLSLWVASWWQPSPATDEITAETEPANRPSSSGLLWDARRAREELTLPQIPELPPTLEADPRARMARSQVIMRGQGREAALAEAERQALISPDLAGVQHHAAMLALGMGDREKARRYFEAALRADPHAMGSLFNLAQMSFRDENFAQATELYLRLIKLNPSQPLAHFRLFLCRLFLGDSVELDSEHFPVGSLAGFYARAVLALREGDTDSARELIETARTRFPGQTRSYDADIRHMGYSF